MPTPAPAPVPGTVSFPAFHFPELHGGAGQIARAFTTYILSGVTQVGLDVWGVIVPFLIALTVISWVFSKIGIAMTDLGRSEDNAEDLRVSYIKKYGGLPDNGRAGL